MVDLIEPLHSCEESDVLENIHAYLGIYDEMQNTTYAMLEWSLGVCSEVSTISSPLITQLSMSRNKEDDAFPEEAVFVSLGLSYHGFTNYLNLFLNTVSHVSKKHPIEIMLPAESTVCKLYPRY